MSATQRKPQRVFLTVTLITVISVTTVFLVYAAVLMTLHGTTVVVNESTGSLVEYSLDGSSWSTSLSAINNGTAWYARVYIDNAASQAVTVVWTLQKIVSSSWVDQSTPVTTSMTLSAGVNMVYATTGGSSSGNYNWGLLTTSGGSYRVSATVNG
jgi:hypothetical protein